MIHFLILGAGTAIPTPTRNAAAYWIEIESAGILMDPGPGALIRAMQSQHGPGDIDGIDTVMLSHLHIDHCNDLAPFLFALHSPLTLSTRPLQLIGPPGTMAYLDKLRDLYGSWVEPTKRELLVQEIHPGQTLIWDEQRSPAWSTGDPADAPANAPSIRVFAARHPQDRFSQVCLCFRFEDRQGHSAVFSGDTEPCSGLEEASHRADLLVVECSTPDELATPGHMTPSQVGALCRTARPRRVVLTHLYPPAALLNLPALIGQQYDGPVQAAQDGELFTLPETLPPEAATEDDS